MELQGWRLHLSFMKRQSLEIRAMRRGWMVWVLAIVSTFAFASAARHRRPRRPKDLSITGKPIGMSAAPITAPPSAESGGEGISSTRQGGGATISTSPAILKRVRLYPLPIHYRIGAWRYRVSHSVRRGKTQSSLRSPPTPRAIIIGFRRISSPITMAYSTLMMASERRSSPAITALPG